MKLMNNTTGEYQALPEKMLSKREVLLRSTKWNANLILLRDYAELVALCKVIVLKTHIPVRTQK